MIGTTAAIIGASIAATGGSVASGVLGSRAAGKAAKSQSEAAAYAAELQKQAADEALAFQKEQWQTTQQNYAPWLEAGKTGLDALLHGMGLGSLETTTTAAEDPYAGQRSQYQESVTGIKSQIDALQQQLQSGALTGVSAILAANQLNALNTELQSATKQLESLPAAPAADGTASITSGDSGKDYPVGYGDLMKDFSKEDFETDPGYQFRLDEGIKAIERSAAAKGGALSGGAVKSALQYNQGFASNEYSNAFNRYNTQQANKYNRLAGLSGVGQSAAQQTAATGQAYANNAGNILTGSAQAQGDYATQGANARASGYMGGANAWGNAIGGITNNIQNALLLDKLLSAQKPVSTGYSI